MKITNNHGISLPMAVWLLHDEYDYRNETNYISATGLLKSVKQTVLAQRVPKELKEIDLSDFIAARLGHAIHDSVERAWDMSAKQQMTRLGYPKGVVESILINPTPEQITPDSIPIFMEQRATKEVGGYLIGGKFDMVIQGRLFDFKSTSVWTYIFKSKEKDYRLQLSIYRWLNPELITEDYGYIQFVFTDWQRGKAKFDPKYPQTRVLEQPVELMGTKETENWILAKLRALSAAWNLPEEQLPPCNDEELWRSDPQYKYYSDPTKTDGRATRNFETMADAQTFMASKAGKGVIKTVPGEVKACEYCAAFAICKQKDQYFA